MYFAAFYAPIIPAATMLSFIQLIILYWALKYNLLRRSCVLNSQSIELSIEMTEMLEFICIIYSGANYIFSYIIRDIRSDFIHIMDDEI